MIDYPKINIPINKLFQLANCSLNLSEFRPICESFSTFDSLNSDENFLRYQIENKVSLLVGAESEKVTYAILSLCWWDSYRKSDHINIESYFSECKLFDEVFSEILEQSLVTIGHPFLQGIDSDEIAHRYAIWQCKTSLLILQQSAYDAQFGYDINFWIQPWKNGKPTPTTPFIDWLFSLRN